MQICDNLSASASPSQLPWEGSQEVCAPPEVLRIGEQTLSQPAADSSPERGALGEKKSRPWGGSFGVGYLVMFPTKRWRIAATWARVALARGRSLPSVPLISFSATAQESGAFA